MAIIIIDSTLVDESVKASDKANTQIETRRTKQSVAARTRDRERESQGTRTRYRERGREREGERGRETGRQSVHQLTSGEEHH